MNLNSRKNFEIALNFTTNNNKYWYAVICINARTYNTSALVRTLFDLEHSLQGIVLHTELISRYTDPANYGAQYIGEQYLFFPAFPRVLLNARSNRINVIVSICLTSQNRYCLSFLELEYKHFCNFLYVTNTIAGC